MVMGGMMVYRGQRMTGMTENQHKKRTEKFAQAGNAELCRLEWHECGRGGTFVSPWKTITGVSWALLKASKSDRPCDQLPGECECQCGD